jgi:hypothetical protein
MASLLIAPRYSPLLFTLCGFISGAIDLCLSIAGVPLVQSSVMFTLAGFITMLLYCGGPPRAKFGDVYLQRDFDIIYLYCGVTPRAIKILRSYSFPAGWSNLVAFAPAD